MDSNQIAQDMFIQWNETLQTKDKQKVAEMYSDDATFLPTLNGELKRGIDGAVEYFEHFLQKNPFGTIIESAVQESSDGGTIIYSGLYDFEVGSVDAREVANARFTYVFQKNENDEWKIIHHHSSLRPE
ncbi:MAG: SgcJ/EcaC family oxidoreductase [Candidatus Moraniibacteriota bacterium]|jgi:uncharacterized protein (TIGR02246 family)